MKRLGWIAAALVLALGCPVVAAAQSNPSLTEAERGIRRDGEAAERAPRLRIETLQAAIHVVGATADVTLDMLIASDSDDPYEGRLALDLPADAAVTGYALDVEGRLIPGVLLEQPKARNVYEDEVRRGIDPGLAEVSADNRFTTRIYPIDAKHPRRFRVSFVAPLDAQGRLLLPLMRDAPIASVEASVTVDGYAAPPAVRFAGRAIALDGGRGTMRATEVVLRDGLSIDGGTLVGPMAVARHASGESFFVVSDGKDVAAKAPRGGRLRIYWDRSRSHRDPAPIEGEVLARLVESTTPRAIDFVTFASDAPRISVVQGVAGLRAALAKVVYRGATSLAGLDGLALPAADRCVMVFDGQVTIDRAELFAPDCPLSIVTAAPGADGARLGRIAARVGGRVIRLAAGKAADAAAMLARPATVAMSVRDDAGRRLGYRALPAGDGRWLLVGQMPATGAVHVRLSDGTVRRYAPDGAAVAGDAPGALWAVQQVGELGDDPSRHAAMAALARRYSVAGPAMAFLVLERPDQYLAADIAPPAGFPQAWLATYEAARRDADSSKADDRRERFDAVLARWSERREWWGRRFTSLRRAPKSNDEDEVTGSRGPPPPPPPPPPAPAPPSSPSRATMDSATPVMEVSGDVVVTANRAPPASPAQRDGDRAIAVDLTDLTAGRPYVAALASATPARRLAVLAAQERAHGDVPSFYFDVADWFRLKGDAATADLLLLSALDLPTSDDETRQIVAFRLERDKHHDRAVELAEGLAAVNADFRPQPGRDLALALAARGKSRGQSGRADLERAFTLLVDTALNPASDDFDGIEVVALMEANALIPAITSAGGRWALDKRLVGLLDADARIVIAWTADDADIDLWVDEPNGERVYYGDKESSAGGLISNDMTDGYGPEEYVIRRAPPGAYRVRINGYDADRLNPNGPGHVLIRLVRNFARAGEQAVLVDADLSFQQGADRDSTDETRPIAVLRVGR